MSIKTACLVHVVLTNAAVVKYTSQTNVTTRITGAVACNTSAGTILLTVTAVLGGVTVTLIKALPIGAGLSYNCPELVGRTLAPADTLSANDGTGSVTSFVVDGYKIS